MKDLIVLILAIIGVCIGLAIAFYAFIYLAPVVITYVVIVSIHRFATRKTNEL